MKAFQPIFVRQKLRCFCPGRSRTAVNRAVETIPGNSLIAVLSTSALLLPASTGDVSAQVSPMPVGDKVAGSTINGISSKESTSDIFVAFEQIRSSFSARGSWRSPGAGTEGFGPSEGGTQRNPGAEGTRYDQHGHVRHPNNTGDESEGLLVTVLPSHVTTGGKDLWSSHQAEGVRGAQSKEEEGEGQDRHRGAEDTWQASFEAGTPPLQPAATRQPLRPRLSDAAPLPLLVFDTQTFLALGELDERFTFQGGVAEWISRARLGSIDQDGAFSADTDGSCCCDASSRKRSATGGDIPTGRPFSDGTAVQHVRASEWGKRIVESWPDESVRPPRGSSAETGKPDARRPGVAPYTGDGEQRGEIREQVFRPGESADADEDSQPRDFGTSRTSDDNIIVDQWTRLPPARLEALVQRDADLFFLRLLLLQHSSGENYECLFRRRSVHVRTTARSLSCVHEPWQHCCCLYSAFQASRFEMKLWSKAACSLSAIDAIYSSRTRERC